jgi:hypothetical protein
LRFLIHTDFGHDPDDAVAISYLIDHGHVPDIIGISPGHIQQNESLSGFCHYHKIYPDYYQSQDKQYNEGFTTGKHRGFDNDSIFVPEPIEEVDLRVDKALVIGPAKNIGHKLECDELVFQGGYSPNSVHPLEKFAGQTAIPSFNPNGAKEDFNAIVESKKIKVKYFVGKNVCHGFTKADLAKIWSPKPGKMKKFWDSLSETKAMHDVLAAIMLIDKEMGVWRQEKPVWHGNKLSTVPTDEQVLTLVGIRV